MSTGIDTGGLTSGRVADDVIRLSGVRAVGRHGVLAAEHTTPQPFVVDVAMVIDTAEAGRTDALEATVSYAEVAADVVAVLEGDHVDLIETLAARIAEAVLTRELVEAVEVTVHKPEAPVGVPFADVAVTVCRLDTRRAVVALGSNQGEVATMLNRAVADLRALPRTRVTAVSPAVESDPVGEIAQPAFLNAVALLETTLRPGTLMRALHSIEAARGRVRDARWGPRTLDLDLVQYGDPRDDTDVVSDGPYLILPHPRAHERGFVLAPWLLADPGAVLRLGGAAVPVADLPAATGGKPGSLPPGVRHRGHGPPADRA